MRVEGGIVAETFMRGLVLALFKLDLAGPAGAGSFARVLQTKTKTAKTTAKAV